MQDPGEWFIGMGLDTEGFLNGKDFEEEREFALAELLCHVLP